jgi:hypothetical protein
VNLSPTGRYIPGMTGTALWHQELRRCGWQALLAPVIAAALLFFVLVAGPSGPGFLGQWLLGAAVPVPAGLCAAAVVAGERMTELQLTMPRSFVSTVCRRLALLGGLVLVSVALLVLALTVSERSAHPLSVLAPLCCSVVAVQATAAWLAITLRSTAGASAAVVGVWMGKLFILDRLPSEPVTQAIGLLLAVVLFTLALRRLQDNEYLMDKEAQ